MNNKKNSWLEKLRVGLKKSTLLIGDSIKHSFLNQNTQKLEENQIESIFENLIQGDVGVEFAEDICKSLKRQSFENVEKALEIVYQQIIDVLSPFSQPFYIQKSENTHVILVSGVNGSGKTTSIAKLTYMCLKAGLSVEWAACDTFRAAALEQLRIWGERLNVPLYSEYPGHSQKIDPASLAFYALEQATQKKTNVLFIDTAGRLQNNEALMNELARIVKVLRKIDSQSPHQSLLIIDGSTGQNAYSQVELFKKYIPLSGLVITKLDGTSKAGFFIKICQKTKLPVVAIGVGEQLDDMNTLNPQEFSQALLGL